MIYTTYYAKLREVPKYMRGFSISNSQPAGTHLPPLWQVTPAWSAVSQYKQSGDWDTFRDRYLVRLASVDKDSLLPHLTGGDVVLVCYEKDASRCHRSILAEWITKELGLPVKEWGYPE